MLLRRLGSVVQRGDPVWKRGAGSRVQRGVITSTSAFATERNSRLQFTKQITVIFHNGASSGAIHEEGDDGCPLFDARNNLIGIVIGVEEGTSPHVIATPIGRVFEALGVRLAT